MSQQSFPGIEPPAMRDPLDRYYTPDALADALVRLLPVQECHTVVEPNVGGGAFARAIRSAHGVTPVGVDLDPKAAGRHDCEFIHGDWLDTSARYDWCIGNPPYSDAERHVRHSLGLCENVVYLLRLAFLESAERVAFWREFPVRKVWVLAQRPSFTGGGTDSCAYGWFWWSRPCAWPAELEVLSWRGTDPEPEAGAQVGLF